MAKNSKEIIEKIKKLHRKSKKFSISRESDNKFYFDGTYYSPDLVLRNKETGRVEIIIEVEQGTRKHVVGGVITADYCMGKIGEKPLMIIVALHKQDRKDYAKREKLFSAYIKNLTDVIIWTEKEFIEELKGYKL